MVDDAEESQLKGGRRFGALHLRDAMRRSELFGRTCITGTLLRSAATRRNDAVHTPVLDLDDETLVRDRLPIERLRLLHAVVARAPGM